MVAMTHNIFLDRRQGYQPWYWTNFNRYCKQRTDMHSAIMYYKILNDLAPSYLTHLITRFDQIHNHNTRRNSRKKHVYSTNTKQLLTIPTQTRNANTLPAFRYAYLKHLYANNNSSVLVFISSNVSCLCMMCVNVCIYVYTCNGMCISVCVCVCVCVCCNLVTLFW
jgi:hypothetical protein